MSLPKINVPKYKHKLIGLNKTIEYRPFTVKEQKILLSAKESSSEDDVIQAIEQIIDACTFGKVDVTAIPYFDFEDIFVRIRAKSVSNEVSFSYQTKDTKERVDVSFNLDDVEVKQHEGHSNVIMIDDSVGMKLAYPTITTLSNSKDEIDLLKQCIDVIFDGDEVYSVNEVTQEEFDEFIESLDMGTMEKIKTFFETMPRLEHEQEVQLPNGETTTIKFKGLNDFF